MYIAIDIQGHFCETVASNYKQCYGKKFAVVGKLIKTTVVFCLKTFMI